MFDKYPTADIKRGDIWYIDLGENSGSEQNGKRPCVITQNDIGNKYSPTITVVPMTTYRPHKSKALLPTQVIIRRSHESGLNRDSIVMCEQVKTPDKLKYLSFAGRLNDEEMQEIDKSLKIHLGIYSDMDKAIDMAKEDENSLLANTIKTIMNLCNKAKNSYIKTTDDLSLT